MVSLVLLIMTNDGLWKSPSLECYTQRLFLTFQVQSGNWNGTSQPQTVNLISTDQGWSTIKLENPGQAPQTVQVASPGGKTSTINTSGLQFISTGMAHFLQTTELRNQDEYMQPMKWGCCDSQKNLRSRSANHSWTLIKLNNFSEPGIHAKCRKNPLLERLVMSPSSL